MALPEGVLVRSTNGGEPKIGEGKGPPWGDQTKGAHQVAPGGNYPRRCQRSRSSDQRNVGRTCTCLPLGGGQTHTGGGNLS